MTQIGPTTFHYTFIPGKSDSDRCLVLFHSTGGDEYQLLELGAALDPNADLLGVRGNSLEEGHNRFFRRHAEGLFDQQDLMMQCYHFNHFLPSLLKEKNLPTAVTGVGFSNGANFLAALLFNSPDLFSNALLIKGVYPFDEDRTADLSGKQILMTSSDPDPLAPLESAATLARQLKASGAEVEMRVVSSGHAIGRIDVQIASAWMQNLS